MGDGLARDPEILVVNFTFHGEQPRIRKTSVTLVGSGATASVYRAELYAKTYGITVALKVQPKHESRFNGQLLAREMRLWANLRHKHVLPFYGSCDFDQSHIALISPYMANGTMIKYLIEHPSANTLLLIAQVLEGVCYLHNEAGVVHGDLKCENVLISASGSALVADFGLSTTIETYTEVTSTEIRNCYTFRFAAPELLFGEDGPGGSHPMSLAVQPRRSKTVPSDVYAMGMLIYQAYTLSPPWPRATLLELALRISERSGPPRPMDDQGISIIPDPVWTICSPMWSYSPINRPRLADVLDLVLTLLSDQ